jgi:serine/threonine-protein kinase RsbT
MTQNGTNEALFSESFIIQGDDYEHGGEIATKVKSILKELGIDPALIRRLSIANFEAEMNVIMYAEEGKFEFRVFPGKVEVILSDRGKGIPNIDLALQEGWSTATPEMRARGFGAGLGLPNIRKNTDEFRIDSEVGVGTTLRYAILLK